MIKHTSLLIIGLSMEVIAISIAQINNKPFYVIFIYIAGVALIGFNSGRITSCLKNKFKTGETIGTIIMLLAAIISGFCIRFIV